MYLDQIKGDDHFWVTFEAISIFRDSCLSSLKPNQVKLILITDTRCNNMNGYDSLDSKDTEILRV